MSAIPDPGFHDTLVAFLTLFVVMVGNAIVPTKTKKKGK